MDVLSDTLRVVRLAGATFFTAKLCSPWTIASPPPEEVARILRLRTDCIALFHVLTEGTCWIALAGEPPLWMEAGDVVIFPHGSAHLIGSTTGGTRDTPPTPLGALLPMQPGQDIPAIDVAGPGPVSRFICGYFSCDQRFNPLIGTLPSLLLVHMRPDAERHEPPQGAPTKVRSTSSYVLPVQSGDWLEVTLRHATEEADSQHPGSLAMLARLTELVYVELLRRYMRMLPAEQGGWLAGVRDPVVGEVLRLLHAHPERPWTVDGLAQASAVSRSTLAQRFADLIGESPIHYLALWRIHLAKQLLLQTALSMKEIALRVGYESEVAFNRAFRRLVGQPPGVWRVSISQAE